MIKYMYVSNDRDMYFIKLYYISHVRTHTGEKPYRCTICDSAFGSNGNRHAHESRHANMDKLDKQYKCHTCAARFVAKNSLAKHIKTFHLTTTVPTNLYETDIISHTTSITGHPGETDIISHTTSITGHPGETDIISHTTSITGHPGETDIISQATYITGHPGETDISQATSITGHPGETDIISQATSITGHPGETDISHATCPNTHVVTQNEVKHGNIAKHTMTQPGGVLYRCRICDQKLIRSRARTGFPFFSKYQITGFPKVFGPKFQVFSRFFVPKSRYFHTNFRYQNLEMC